MYTWALYKAVQCNNNQHWEKCYQDSDDFCSYHDCCDDFVIKCAPPAEIASQIKSVSTNYFPVDPTLFKTYNLKPGAEYFFAVEPQDGLFDTDFSFTSGSDSDDSPQSKKHYEEKNHYFSDRERKIRNSSVYWAVSQELECGHEVVIYQDDEPCNEMYEVYNSCHGVLEEYPKHENISLYFSGRAKDVYYPTRFLVPQSN